MKEYTHIERIKTEKFLEITDSPLSQNIGMSEWYLSLSQAVSAIECHAFLLCAPLTT